jgi:hypothetical protein
MNQSAFARALRTSEDHTGALTTWNGSDPAQRINIYRNNVMVGWLGALADNFPLTRAIMGAEAFQAFSRAYVCAFPPRDRRMAFYGDGLHLVLRDCESDFPNARLAAECALLDEARRHAYHSADCPLLPAQALAKIAPDALFDCRFAFHSSLALIRSSFALEPIWRAFVEGRLHDCDGLIADQDILVFRENDLVVTLFVDCGVAAFFNSLQQGASLGVASAAGFAPRSSFDLAAALRLLLRFAVAVERPV